MYQDNILVTLWQLRSKVSWLVMANIDVAIIAILKLVVKDKYNFINIILTFVMRRWLGELF